LSPRSFDAGRISDVLALAASAVWFAVNVALWVVIEAAIELLLWSSALGAVYFVGFFGYRGYWDRKRAGRSEDRCPD
jgi:hypothetical protein